MNNGVGWPIAEQRIWTSLPTSVTSSDTGASNRGAMPEGVSIENKENTINNTPVGIKKPLFCIWGVRNIYLTSYFNSRGRTPLSLSSQSVESNTAKPHPCVFLLNGTNQEITARCRYVSVSCNKMKNAQLKGTVKIRNTSTTQQFIGRNDFIGRIRATPDDMEG